MFDFTRQEKLLIIFIIASFLIGALVLFLKNTGTIDLETASQNLLEEHNIVNINSASAKELAGLKGIGQVLADRIISYREKNGPFKDKEDLKKVKGIGQHKFGAIKENISVE